MLTTAEKYNTASPLGLDVSYHESLLNTAVHKDEQKGSSVQGM